MKYLLDSDTVIDLLQNREETSTLARRLIGEGVALSVISYMEVKQGLYRKPEPERLRFHKFVNGIALLPVDIEIADRCAELRVGLMQQKRKVRSRALDLLIAATAIEHGLTLVTRNLADFKDVPDLEILGSDDDHE